MANLRISYRNANVDHATIPAAQTFLSAVVKKSLMDSPPARATYKIIVDLI
jgi:hypothetical protein